MSENIRCVQINSGHRQNIVVINCVKVTLILIIAVHAKLSSIFKGIQIKSARQVFSKKYLLPYLPTHLFNLLAACYYRRRHVVDFMVVV